MRRACDVRDQGRLLTQGSPDRANWQTTHLSNVLLQEGNQQLGHWHREGREGTLRQPRVFYFGWLGCGWERVHHSQRLSVCLSVCLAEFVIVVDRGVERSTHSAISQLFLLLFETGVCYTAQAGPEPVTLLLQSPDCWDYRCMPTCLDCCCVI